MTVSELIDLMSEEDEICIEDLEKPIDDMELFCGKVNHIKNDESILDLEVNGIVAVDDLIYACVRKVTKYHWEKYGNKIT